MSQEQRPPDLSQRRCVPCEAGTPFLLTGWSVEEPVGEPMRLMKRFRFRDFVGAVAFVNALTPVAEAEGHHPDLYVRWGEVRVTVWTHAAGGLTENDFILAAKIDEVASN
jgi:4a-hydroxytetrahydrobiopterin dehydratase